MSHASVGQPRLWIQEGAARQVARLMALRGAEADLEQRFHAHFALALPRGPELFRHHQVSVVGVAPGSWLVMDSHSAQALMPRLRAAVETTASACDLSDAYLFRQVLGTAARACLAKLVPIDLHATQFPIGRALSTRAAHVSLLLWRLEDEAGLPVFELGVPRSYARYVYGELEHAAAGFIQGASR